MRDLRTIRKQFELTEMELAERAEIDHLTVRYIENQKSRNPQADVRRRLEIVFNERIDWMKTGGIGKPIKIHWEECETNLRKTLLKIAGLPKGEQDAMLMVARTYVDSLEEMIIHKIEEEENVKVPVGEHKALTMKRKHI